MPNPEEFERVVPPFRRALCHRQLWCYELVHRWLTEWANIVRQRCSVSCRVLPLGMVCLSVVFSGCSKKPTVEPPVSSANLLKADGQVDLQAFTLLLHRYVERVNKVPADVNEMVSSGFVPSLPEAPPGKRWVIKRGAMDFQVIVADK